MKRATILGFSCFIACGMISLSAFAEGLSKKEPLMTGSALRSQDQMNQRVSELIGKTAKSTLGERLGSIKDLVLASDGGISYIIVAVGGIMGVNENLVPIPWHTAAAKITDDAVVLRVDKRHFDGAPSFKSSEWVTFFGTEWQQKVHGYYEKGKSPLSPAQEYPSPFAPSK